MCFEPPPPNEVCLAQSIACWISAQAMSIPPYLPLQRVHLHPHQHVRSVLDQRLAAAHCSFVAVVRGWIRGFGTGDGDSAARGLLRPAAAGKEIGSGAFGGCLAPPFVHPRNIEPPPPELSGRTGKRSPLPPSSGSALMILALRAPTVAFVEPDTRNARKGRRSEQVAEQVQAAGGPGCRGGCRSWGGGERGGGRGRPDCRRGAGSGTGQGDRAGHPPGWAWERGARHQHGRTGGR